MLRRNFIKSLLATVAAVFVPVTVGARVKESRAWSQMIGSGDGWLQIYRSDDAVAIFGYASDGYPQKTSLRSIEQYNRLLKAPRRGGFIKAPLPSWDWHHDYLKSIKYGRENRHTRHIITTNYPNHIEMTEDNVDMFFANYKNSSFRIAHGGTSLTPEQYLEWQENKRILPDKDFRHWARETHGLTTARGKR